MGAGTYAGVDFKLRELSVGVLRYDELGTAYAGTATSSCPASYDYQQALVWMREAVLDTYRQAANRAGINRQYAVTRDMARLVLVEQPGGNRFPRKLCMAEGVITSVLAAKTAVVDVGPQTWRKVVLGRGNLKSEEAKRFAVDHVRSAYRLDLSHDEAEALCMAEYAATQSGGTLRQVA